MTDTTPMRTRMIAALDNAAAEWVKSQGGDKGMADMPTEVLVDAILSVLETPSDEMRAVIRNEKEMYDTEDDLMRDLVKAIRGGA